MPCSRPRRRSPASTGVLILYGDTPFVEPATLRRMLDRLDGDGCAGRRGARFQPGRSANYGRIILGEGDRIAKMVEYKDATEEERAVRLCNSGMMAVRARRPVPLARQRSATTMPQANIICPTSS